MVWTKKGDMEDWVDLHGVWEFQLTWFEVGQYWQGQLMRKELFLLNDICSAHIGSSEHSLCFEIVKLGCYHIWPVSNSFVVISYLLLNSLERCARNFVDDLDHRQIFGHFGVIEVRKDK